MPALGVIVWLSSVAEGAHAIFGCERLIIIFDCLLMPVDSRSHCVHHFLVSCLKFIDYNPVREACLRSSWYRGPTAAESLTPSLVHCAYWRRVRASLSWNTLLYLLSPMYTTHTLTQSYTDCFVYLLCAARVWWTGCVYCHFFFGKI
jgi:hypothetical protein